jgi:hypothetical protein
MSGSYRVALGSHITKRSTEYEGHKSDRGTLAMVGTYFSPGLPANPLATPSRIARVEHSACV